MPWRKTIKSNEKKLRGPSGQHQKTLISCIQRQETSGPGPRCGSSPSSPERIGSQPSRSAVPPQALRQEGVGPEDCYRVRLDEGDFVGVEALLLHTRAAFYPHEGSGRRCQHATGTHPGSSEKAVCISREAEASGPLWQMWRKISKPGRTAQ